MAAAPAHALDDHRVGHVDLEHVIECHAGVAQRVGLRNGARKAVEQVAVAAIGLAQAVAHQPDDDFVGHQPPESMTFFAESPSGDPAFTAERSMSPVEICGMAQASQM